MFDETFTANLTWSKYFDYRYQSAITNIISIIDIDFIIYSHKYEEYDVDTFTFINSSDGTVRFS